MVLRRIKGFTLIEILVVVLIVSIMSGIAIANLPGLNRTADFDTESRRLMVLLDLARQEAIVQTSELGFKPGISDYAFFIYDEGVQKWLRYERSPFRQRFLPENIKLELEVEEHSLTLSTDREDPVPPVLLLSSGETTPFTLTIFFEDSAGRTMQKSLTCDGYSDIEWVVDE